MQFLSYHEHVIGQCVVSDLCKSFGNRFVSGLRSKCSAMKIEWKFRFHAILPNGSQHLCYMRRQIFKFIMQPEQTMVLHCVVFSLLTNGQIHTNRTYNEIRIWCFRRSAVHIVHISSVCWTHRLPYSELNWIWMNLRLTRLIVGAPRRTRAQIRFVARWKE